MIEEELVILQGLVQDYEKMKSGDYAWISKEEFDKKFGHGFFVTLLVKYFNYQEKRST
jgi:hypothetical protein